MYNVVILRGLQRVGSRSELNLRPGSTALTQSLLLPELLLVHDEKITEIFDFMVFV